MIYLICQDWSNTSKNHAGMRYLADHLGTKYSNEFTTIIVPSTSMNGTCNNPIIRKLRHKINMFHNAKALMNIYIPQMTNNDTVILMEYCELSSDQYKWAKKIKAKLPNIKLYGVAHLVPELLNKQFSDRRLKKWTQKLDGIITLGHTLSDYFVSKGIDINKIHTTFHYVDNYYCNHRMTEHKQKTVIVMGNMMRDIDLLKQIVCSNNHIKFIICQGMSDLHKMFPFDNVTLIPFVEESELRDLMAQSDISLNVMKDTIGSNVIVTSMAMGLAMVCSNVGSITDYCNEENSILCSGLDEFNYALKRLTNDESMLEKMRQSSKEISSKFSIESFYTDLKNNILLK